MESCNDEEKQEIIGLSAKGTELYKNRLKVNLPSIEGLALYLHVHKDTLYEWEKIHPEFSDVLGDIRAKQADRLISNGLSGDYNPTIAKLLLTKHGYSDKQEITGADGKDLIPTPILGNLNVHTDDRYESDSETVETDTDSAGRNISEQDDLDTPIADSSQPDRQETDTDERRI